jgi:hypothetical protein
MLKKIIVALGVILVVLAIIVAMQPAQYHYSRSATMSAPPATVFAQVNDFHNWEAWSPWAKIDPNAKNSFEGPVSGIGAIFRWAGNMEVGEGSMTITDSRPDQFIRIRLDFLKPLPGTSTAEFTFVPDGNQTRVTWSMYGENNFLAKAISLVMNCEEMIGGYYEKGLAQMKSLVEAKPN